MAELHDPEDEPECDAEFDFDYEKKVGAAAGWQVVGCCNRRLLSLGGLPGRERLAVLLSSPSALAGAVAFQLAMRSTCGHLAWQSGTNAYRSCQACHRRRGVVGGEAVGELYRTHVYQIRRCDDINDDITLCNLCRLQSGKRQGLSSVRGASPCKAVHWAIPAPCERPSGLCRLRRLRAARAWGGWL